MPIDSNKPTKKCRYCNRDVVNLGLHIANVHPSVFEQIDETTHETTPQSPSTPPNTPQKALIIAEDTETLIRRKLNTLMDIQIIKALGSGADIMDIKKMVEPQKTPEQVIKDTIALHNAIYPPNTPNLGGVIAEPDNTGKWLELATNALPMITQMLPNKRKEIEEEKKNDAEHRTIEERSPGIRRLISQKDPGNTGQPSNTSGESSPINGAKQQDSGKSPSIN